MRDGSIEMLVYWSAGNFSNTPRLPLSLITDLYHIHSVFWNHHSFIINKNVRQL